MSSYVVEVVETIVTRYRIGGVDTEDQALSQAEEDNEDRSVGRQIGQPRCERSSSVVDPAA